MTESGTNGQRSGNHEHGLAAGSPAIAQR